MLVRLLASLLLLLPIAAQAQYQGCRQISPGVDFSQACIILSSSNVLDINGNKLSAGRFVLTVTDSSGTPVAYTPQGGSSTSQAFVGQIINGQVQNIAGFPFTIVNTLNASPSGLVFHYQLQSPDGSMTNQDYPLWSITSTTGGTSLDTFNALPGSTISGVGYPRTSCSPTAKYNQTDGPMGAKPWICSNLWRSDKSNQWTQNPSSNPQCMQGQAIVSPRVGTPYCILPENAYALPNEGFVNPSTTTPGPMMVDPLATSGANLPHDLNVITGDGLGGALWMPEKPVTKVGTDEAFVQCDEDVSNGRFDPRCTQYAGGVDGPTPGLAMQAISDRVICYQGMTNRHAYVKFPPRTIIVGTDAHPTLKLPGGAIYEGGGGWGFGTNATQFQSTYNNRTTWEIDDGLTSTGNCSDGVPHTSTLTGGSFDGISQHGCGQGGCHNVPGDTGNYPIGGPLQIGGVFQDAQGSIGQKAGVFANNNGGDGLKCGADSSGAGLDSHCYELGGAANNGYFYFGMDVAGQNYQFASGECHGDVDLIGLDNMNAGLVEVYGTFMPLGWEYGHVAGICWGGGLTNLGHYFSQIEEIGVIHMAGGNTEASADSGRIDAPRGDGILELSSGKTTWINPRVIGACRYDGAGTNSWLVYSVATATPGSAQTPGPYLLTGSDGISQILVTVAGGGTVTADPVVTVHSRGMTSTPPTYTLAAGGTPATFTVTMAPVFALLHIGTGTPFAGCDYVDDQSAGGNVWNVPLLIDNGFFGASHATGDIASVQQETWIYPKGNNGGGGVIWEPGLVTGAFTTAENQRIVNPDQIHGGGGTPWGGSTINIYLAGGHVQLVNGSPTTLTAITGGTMMSDLWITGDGFTTMPEFTINTVFGAKNCSTHDLLFARGQRYHYLLTNQDLPTLPPVYTEQCDSIDQTKWWVGHEANAGSLPPLVQQMTSDIMGSQAIHAIPTMAAPTIQAGGTPGPNGIAVTNTYAVRVWGTFGTQTSAVAGPITQCLPLAGFINNPCFQTEHWTLPEGWTHWQLFRETSSDGVATPGMIAEDQETKPQPAGTAAWPDSRVAPTNANVIGSCCYSANMTGTRSDMGSTVPPQTPYPGILGQTILSVTNHAIYTCDATDHWVVSVIPAFNTF